MSVPLSEEYRVNIKVLDEHHERLFNMIERLRSAVAEGRGREEAEKILGELCDYAEEHFSVEEGMMKEAKYAALSAHRVAHREFISQVREMMTESAKGKKNTLSLDIAAFLNDWLRKHIRIADQQYAPLLKSKGYK